MLRDFTEDNGSLLIFDEVISFRVAPGGAQETYGVTPDLTSLGKIVGGGFPVGAFGGRKEIMDLYDPTRGPRVSHAGTFNANPVTMVAGATTMELLTPSVYRNLAESDRTAQAGHPGSLRGTGNASAGNRPRLALWNSLHALTEIRTYRDIAAEDADLRHRDVPGPAERGNTCSLQPGRVVIYPDH